MWVAHVDLGRQDVSVVQNTLLQNQTHLVRAFKLLLKVKETL